MNSFQAAPLAGVTLQVVAALFTSDLGRFLMSAVEIAAPLIGALFLTELAMGLLNRAAPQVNVLTIGFIVKILLALLLVGIALPLLPGVIDGLLGDALASMAKLAG